MTATEKAIMNILEIKLHVSLYEYKVENVNIYKIAGRILPFKIHANI